MKKLILDQSLLYVIGLGLLERSLFELLFVYTVISPFVSFERQLLILEGQLILLFEGCVN